MSTGRPRSFDAEQALEKAMHLFWAQGYEGTSIADLTQAMGINRPSLYAAFGDKENLFRKALDRYRAGPAAFVAKALAEPTADLAVAALFRGAAIALTSPDTPKGCFAVHGALACSDEAAAIREELAAQRRASEGVIRARLEAAQSEGDLDPALDTTALARFVAAMFQGMAVQAAGGTTREAIQELAEISISAWRGLTSSGVAESR